MKLQDVLNTIKDNAFHTSDPLIIITEIPLLDNIKQNKMIVDMFKHTFGDRIFMPTSQDFTQYAMKDLLNKIIIIGRFNEPTLREIMHDASTFDNFRDDAPMIATKKEGTMSRVYMHDSIESALSYNLDGNYFRSLKHNCIATNFQTKDKYMYENILFFKDHSFIPMQ